LKRLRLRTLWLQRGAAECPCYSAMPSVIRVAMIIGQKRWAGSVESR